MDIWPEGQSSETFIVVQDMHANAYNFVERIASRGLPSGPVIEIGGRNDEIRFAGRDAFPDDCVLVVVSPAMLHRLTEAAASRTFPVTGPMVASWLIDWKCDEDPELAKRIRWERT